MKIFFKYKSSALILAAIFCIFNIGIAVIIASCPMMKEMAANHSCCPNQENTKSSKLTSQKNFTCCTTVVAAERNRTEFVPVSDAVKNICTVDVLNFTSQNNEALYVNSFSLVVHQTSSPPPIAEDIPIFTSSLRI